MTSPACPICDEHDASPVPGPQDDWQYYRCHRCDHWWLYPPPAQERLDEFYNGAYAVPIAGYFSYVKREGSRMVRLVRSWRPALGRMLEIGCSYGGMLAAMRDAGWTVHGMELDARAAEYARQTYKLPVSSASIESDEADLARPYDVIAAYHVIEHVVDVAPFVARLRSLADDGSLLVLKTPNNRSLAARGGVAWWQWAMRPEHVHLFSPASLRLLLERHGFAVRFETSRRGPADPTTFELVRSFLRRTVAPNRRRHEVGNPYSFRSDPWRARSWYKVGERIARVVTAPIDVLWYLATRAGAMIEPELLVVAAAETLPGPPATPVRGSARGTGIGDTA